MYGMRDLSQLPPIRQAISTCTTVPTICFSDMPPICFLLRAMHRLVGSTQKMVAAMGRAMREPYKEDLGGQQEEVEEEGE